MQVQQIGTNQLQIHLGDTLIAEAQPSALSLDIAPPPTFEAALNARDQSPSLLRNINPMLPGRLGFHPICFCCGADAEVGLRVYAAPVTDFDGVAAAWRPQATFADGTGIVAQPIIWAALDCPGQFAYFAAGVRTGMLGRMTAKIIKPVIAEQDMVITGWCIEVERSKHFAGTALFDSSGELYAYSKQVWIGRRN